MLLEAGSIYLGGMEKACFGEVYPCGTYGRKADRCILSAAGITGIKFGMFGVVYDGKGLGEKRMGGDITGIGDGKLFSGEVIPGNV